MTRFKGSLYKIGHNGMVFRLKHLGSESTPDDWLRSTVTQGDLDAYAKNIIKVRAQQAEANTRYNNKRALERNK